MYKNEVKNYGLKITLEGSVSEDEMKAWCEDVKKLSARCKPEFGVVVDMRNLKPVGKEAQPHLQEGQKFLKGKGMARSAVVLASATQVMQFKRIAKETGIAAWERYINSTATPNWEQVGADWAGKAVDPDKAPVTA